jgi:hypothetical protein
MDRHERFSKFIGGELANELLNGASIIEAYLPENKPGLLILERNFPLIEDNPKFGEPREFWFVRYQQHKANEEFFRGTDYVKMRRKEIIKRAFADR